LPINGPAGVPNPSAGPISLHHAASKPTDPRDAYVASTNRDQSCQDRGADIAPISAENPGWRQHKWGLIRLASPIVLVALWQLGSAVGLIPQDVLPAPSLIAEAGIEVL
jgi:hypothetical protein